MRERERMADQRLDRVGDEHLLDEALHEPQRTLAKQRDAVFALLELSGKVLVAKHRAGDQMREQRDEGREIDRMLGSLDIPSIDKIGRASCRASVCQYV